MGDGTAEQGESNINFKNLTWWQINHPGWVLYQCDRVTPATYWGPGIGLDITNPDVLEWQLHAPSAENSRSAMSIAAGGYDSISLDVISTGNWFRACGRWEPSATVGGSPTWKQMYTNATDDPRYAADVLTWLKKFYAGLKNIRTHAGERLLLVPNCPAHKGSTVPGFWGTGAWNSTFIFTVGNNSDGVLSEEGFTGYGHGLVHGDEWLNKFLFMQNLQRHKKAYFSINYQLNDPAAPDPKPVLPITVELEKYVLASFLISKEQSAAVMLGSHVGYDKGRLTAFIGTASEAGHELAPGVWKREFADAVAIVNVNSVGKEYAIHLDPAFTYKDQFTGEDVPASKPFVLQPSSGSVLLRKKINAEVVAI